MRCEHPKEFVTVRHKYRISELDGLALLVQLQGLADVTHNLLENLHEDTLNGIFDLLDDAFGAVASIIQQLFHEEGQYEVQPLLLATETDHIDQQFTLLGGGPLEEHILVILGPHSRRLLDGVGSLR